MINNKTGAVSPIKDTTNTLQNRGKVTVTRDDLVERIHQNENTTVTKSDVVMICKSIVKEMESQLANNNEVKLSKFGTFGIRNRPPRIGKNPLTGEPVNVEATRSVYFRASAYLKNLVNLGVSSQ